MSDEKFSDVCAKIALTVVVLLIASFFIGYPISLITRWEMAYHSGNREKAATIRRDLDEFFATRGSVNKFEPLGYIIRKEQQERRRKN